MVGLPYYIWSNPSGINLHGFIVVTLYFFEAKCKIDMKSPGKFNWLFFFFTQPIFVPDSFTDPNLHQENLEYGSIIIRQNINKRFFFPLEFVTSPDMEAIMSN